MRGKEGRRDGGRAKAIYVTGSSKTNKIANLIITCLVCTHYFIDIVFLGSYEL